MLVSVEDLVVVRGETPVLQGVSLTLGPGESLGIAGHNGSGKTTLLRILATLLRPTSGIVEVLGRDTTGKDARLVRPRIGFVGHAPALSPHLTLAENLHYVAALGGIDRGLVPEALAMVGLGRAGDRLAAKASQGMGRRVDLARIVITQPTLLLLDEPFAGLDSHATGIIGAIIERTVARGGAAVVVSHEPDRAATVVDRTITLDNGRVAS
jgi:heme ABC exporter ATP-binding subunit CcmA